MRGYVANTDEDWYTTLRDLQPLEEVNFWQPMGGRGFRVLEPGEPVYFRLKSPHCKVAGFGTFARHDVLPWWLAWEAFGSGNGTKTRREMEQRIQRYRQAHGADPNVSMNVGCLILVQPVFFTPDQWVDGPVDWKGPIVSGKGYDLRVGEGRRIWQECQRAAARVPGWAAPLEERHNSLLVAESIPRFGEPRPVAPRLGQGAFRIAVTAAYNNACAVTREHSLPVIEAAHVRPYAAGGPHAVPNGIALRSDIHRLFDRGYVTFDSDLRFVVSRRLREEYQNGKAYYELEGRRMFEPRQDKERVDHAALEWHREHAYTG